MKHPARSTLLTLVMLLLGGCCLLWNDAGLRHATGRRQQAYLWGWDQNGYFAWGRSLALDGDIDFANDFQFVAQLRGYGSTAAAFKTWLAKTPPTSTGRTPNKYGIGLGLLALPALLTARALAGGPAVSPFAAIYPLAFIATSVTAGFIGLAAAYRILQGSHGRRRAAGAVAAGTLGLSLGYYLWIENTMAHAAGFCLVTLLIGAALAWHRALRAAMPGCEDDMPGRGSTQRETGLLLRAGGMGLMLGLAATVRYTNALYGLVPAVLCAAWALRRRRWRDPALWRLVGPSLAAAAAGALVGFLPQMLAWKVLYGSFLTDSYHDEKLYWWPRNAGAVLFGTRNSLFLWTPLALPAMAGLARAARRGSELAWAGLAAFAAQLWVYGGWKCYWLGDSFGMRGFVECSFFFFLGLAELMRAARTPRARFAVRAGVAALVAWNLFFAICYRAELQPHGQPLAVRRLFANWPRWRKQLNNDLNLAARLRWAKFPLLTPAAAGAEPNAKNEPHRRHHR